MKQDVNYLLTHASLPRETFHPRAQAWTIHLPAEQVTELMLGIAEQSAPIWTSSNACVDAERRSGATSDETKGQPPPRMRSYQGQHRKWCKEREEDEIPYSQDSSPFSVSRHSQST